MWQTWLTPFPPRPSALWDTGAIPRFVAVCEATARVCRSTSPPTTHPSLHSLGGKVLLQLAATGGTAGSVTDSKFAGGGGVEEGGGGRDLLARVRRQRRGTGVPFPFVIVDSMPGSKAPHDMATAHDGVSRVLHLVRSAPRPIPSRTWVQQEAAKAGVDTATGMWLASNVSHAGGGLTWTFDPSAATDLFDSYLSCDLWHTLLRPPGDATFCVAMATKSSRWKDADVKRQVEDATAAANDRRDAAGAVELDVRFHSVEGGHWLHVDNPRGLLDVVTHTPGLRPAA